MKSRLGFFAGLSKVILISALAYIIAMIPVIKDLGISPLIIGIILGIIYAHTLKHKTPLRWSSGVIFSAKRVLRIAIILFGFNLSFQLIASVGLSGLLASLIVLATTFILGIVLGEKVFKLDRDSSILISAGSSVCGAAAVLAAESAIKSEAYKSAMAVGTVVIFGTLAMFIYPILMKSGLLFLDDTGYGIFTGATIHEVAQVVAAGNAVSHNAEVIAVTVKMIRVMMIAPLLIFVGLWIAYEAKKLSANNSDNKAQVKVVIPWFAVGFIVVAGFNSLQLLPESLVHGILVVDQFMLTMAMTALGIETHFSKFKQAGLKPLLLSLILFIWLILGGLLITHLVLL
ncbi:MULTISPECIES: YeiH family protein [Cysteiniphilum]|uniref:Membrane protein n=1 Tax=Cysteiniphilum litorale TaxID=2056700 RepID=A0A8J3E9S5_9GAMM|nr:MULTISPECIES: YeiH family protein [Cysteiniphilum]GGG03568.1 membrane protein [Cysteiniphilum litorale]